VFAGHYSDDSPVLRERFRGFTDVLKQAGIHLPKSRVLPDYPSNSQLELCLLSEGEPVMAFFATSDYLVCCLMSSLRDMGYSNPNDISVMGFDNMDLSSISEPKLTTIEQDLEKKAELVANLLFAKIEDPGSPALNITLDVKLVVSAIGESDNKILFKAADHSCFYQTRRRLHLNLTQRLDMAFLGLTQNFWILAIACGKSACWNILRFSVLHCFLTQAHLNSRPRFSYALQCCFFLCVKALIAHTLVGG
jgi:hypothetical protein